MRLELSYFPVRDVKFSNRINYKNGVLEINKEEILTLILQDKRVLSADLDVVFPKEQTRILNVRDVVEPRVKVAGPGCVYPGILGPVETVGEGRTHSLSGVTVMVSAEYNPTIMGGISAQNTAILDMWGPGASLTPFASTINIVVIVRLVEGILEHVAHSAIQSAEFKVAARLAEATKAEKPETMEVFELPKVESTLPKVVYVLSVMIVENEPYSHIGYYGLPIQQSMPILMHPNELLDGALTTDARRGNGGYSMTWHYMNLPVVIELFREHGKRLNFLGVIFQRTRFLDEFGKQITAMCTSQMAKLLGAEGVLITRTTPSGNNFMDVMLTLQACERKGLKTVLITPERGGPDGTEATLEFFVPEALSMISTGSMERQIELPKPTKVVGIEKGQFAHLYVGDPAFDPWEKTVRDGWRDVIGGLDWFGGTNIICKQF